MLIDNIFTPEALGRRFETVNPGTSIVPCDVAPGGGKKLHCAVTSACRAFEEGHGSGKALAMPTKVLLRLAALIPENLPELAPIDFLDIREVITQGSVIYARVLPSSSN